MAFKLSVSIQGQDELTLEYDMTGQTMSSALLQAKGCTKILRLAQEWRPLLQGEVSAVPVPRGKDHASLLLRELVLRLKEQWNFPFAEDELCHCRSVATRTVIDAIYTGSHTAQAVSRKTTASTSCGTCRPNVQEILDFVLGTDKSPEE